MTTKALASLIIGIVLVMPVAAEDLVTVDKKSYQNVRVVRADVDGVVIMYSGGGGKIAFTNLPSEWQKKYGYDPEKAAALAKKQEKIRKLGRMGAVYRLSELDEAKSEAKREGKLIAFLASYPRYMQTNLSMTGNGSGAATIQMFEGLKNTTVLVYSDGETENHTEPPIVNAALHPPENTHYTVPKVVIVDADVSRVIFVIPFSQDYTERQRLLAAALVKIREEKGK